MIKNSDYKIKYKSYEQSLNFDRLGQKEKDFIEQKAQKHFFSFSELRQIVEIAVDLKMWQEGRIDEIWPKIDKNLNPKELKKEIISFLKNYWQKLKNSPIKFQTDTSYNTRKISIFEKNKDKLGFGMCPVASPKTRCCNLMTLDAVESCGFDCSYCSIQSFYNEDKIIFDKDFKKKLQQIKIDPNEIYHIGTGQSSDSLMWGNRYGILDALMEFASKYPNVILEMKTKSKQINYFLENEIPKNVIFTWSLNPQKVIDHEEHLTASLKERLKAAKKLHDKGMIVGFHFHPMIYYEGWEKGYKDIACFLTKNFDPDRVAMVSIGTLTFIKSVIKKIRGRDFYSKILQIPLIDADGKLSYTKEIKTEMFKCLYDSFYKWHDKVYFYLCMENHSLWKDVFGYEYPTNESFEMDMKLNYLRKISNRKKVSAHTV